jgi:GxxExxY protein
MATPSRLLHAEITDLIIRAYWEVLNELGFGYLESVIQRALKIAMEAHGLTVNTEVPLSVWFRGVCVGTFRADLLVNGVVLVEIKLGASITSKHVTQTLNYLRATDVEVAVILLFGPTGEIKRLVYRNDRKTVRPQPPTPAAAQSAAS